MPQTTLIEFRVLRTIVLGTINPRENEQRDLLISPGETVGFDGSTIFLRRRTQWIESTTVFYAIEEWLENGSIAWMDAEAAKRRTPAVLVGQAVGDALGMPFEKLGDEVHPDLASWDGAYRAGTWHALPAGHWTDDTEMAECLANALIARQGFDGEDVAQRYLAWAQGTPHGMGGTTRRACENLARGASWQESGITFDDPDMVGSAPPMRAAPIGLLHTSAAMIVEACTSDARITHVHPEAADASLAVALTVSLMLQGAQTHEALIAVCATLKRESATRRGGAPSLVWQHLVDMQSALTFRQSPPLTWRRGNAWQITSTAIYCALWAESFRDGVIAAIKIGGDTDTRGAIAGAILGARFGLDGIPDEYKAGVLKFEPLAALDQALWQIRR